VKKVNQILLEIKVIVTMKLQVIAVVMKFAMLAARHKNKSQAWVGCFKQ
jgi:hypothetical protein